MKRTSRNVDDREMPKKPVRPKKSKATMQALVYRELRRSLMTGAFVPGAKVTIRSVTEHIGTSVMPVREAINRLIAERALEVVANRQVIVPVMTAEKFSEIIHWRMQLEAAATRAACRRTTPKFIADLETINSKITEAAEHGRRDALLPLNYEFHFLIYCAAQSEILLPMIESLWLQAGPFTYFSTPSPQVLWNAKHHRDIIKALKAGDENAAAAAISRDILNSAEFLKGAGHFARPPVRHIADIAA
jgi:DNA-binding GntR family transcriptional regulator